MLRTITQIISGNTVHQEGMLIANSDTADVAKVLAASTAPVATDSALVVAISPNTPTLPVSVTSAAVTQSTSPWIVAGGGTAGSPASGIVTVQGIASMTPVQVTVNKTALTAASPAAATVGVATAEAVAAAATRKGLILVNTSNNWISIGIGVDAVLYSGITLAPLGGSWQMDEYCFSTAAINAIASAASSNLAIQQFTT